MEIAAYFLLEFTLSIHPIDNKQALHSQPLGGHIEKIGGTRLGFFIVITGDAATGDDAAMHTQGRERSLQCFTAHIIEVDIDPVRGLSLQILAY